MNLAPIFGSFYQNILATTLPEIIAVVFGLLSVWFAKREKILVYPTGIISVLIYVYIFYGAKLYANMGINFFYFIMSVYGWIMWTRKDEQNKVLQITTCSGKENIFNILAIVVFFILLSYILINFTDSDVPYWDSFTTSVFIVAMYLMARKKLENWITWAIGNTISIPLYFYKDLIFTSFQFIVFLVLAILGYIAWKRKFTLSALNSNNNLS